MDTEDRRNGIIEASVENGDFGGYLSTPLSAKQRTELIGNNLLFLRRRAELSQKEVCDIIDCAPQTYSGYEKGKHEPTAETLVRLSHLYKTTLDFLMGRNSNGFEDDPEDYIENVLDNPSNEDLLIQMHFLREDVARIKKHIALDDKTN